MISVKTPGPADSYQLASALVQQNDQKIVLGGSFTSLGAAPASYIARLNANGTIDGTFNPGAGPNQSVRRLALQGDGKIIISGYFTTVAGHSRNGLARLNSDGFTTVNGTARKYVARLNPNGSLDAGFDAGTGPSLSGNNVMLQSDGKLLMQGNFTGTNAAGSRLGYYHLDADGKLCSRRCCARPRGPN